MPRNIPFLESERDRQIGGTAEIEDANLLTDQVRGPADFLLRDDAKRKSVERCGDNGDVAAAQTNGNRRARRALGEVAASGDQGRHAAHAAGNQYQLSFQTMLPE